MILYSILIFFILFLLLRFAPISKVEGLSVWLMPISYILKVFVGIFFLYIYTEYYGNGNLSVDAAQFMKESKILNDVFWQSPSDYFKFLFGFDNAEMVSRYLSETTHWSMGAQTIINDNRNLVRVHSLIHFLSFNNPYIHMLVVNFLSLFAIKNIVIGLKSRTKINVLYLYILILIIPSVLFWSSSILKEPFLILGISLIIRGFLSSEENKKRFLLLLIGAALTLAFKPYIFFLFIPSILFYILFKSLPKVKLIGTIAILSIGLFSILLLFPAKTGKAIRVLSRKQYDFINISKGGIHVVTDTTFYLFKPATYESILIKDDSVQVIKRVEVEIVKHGSIDAPIPITLQKSDEKWPIYFKNPRSNGYIETTRLANSGKQLLLNIPEAISNSLLRPYPNDPGGWLKYPAMLEVWLIFAFLIYAIKYKRDDWKINSNLIYSMVLFILLLSLMIGWVTPVLGAIVRYRIPAYLGIIIISVLLIDPSKGFLALKKK